jgi:hypothetical protein
MTTDRTSTLPEVHLMACIAVPALLVYAAAQTGLCVALGGREHASLRLVVEPYLLLLGLILHVLWRRTDQTYRAYDQPRPRWMAAADCVSFVITFWALFTLLEAFLQQARVW